jgi:hypothetical protein
MSHEQPFTPSPLAGKEAYCSPRLNRHGKLRVITATRVGSGNDMLDSARLSTEPRK